MKLQKFLLSPLGKTLLVLMGLALYYLVFIYPLNSLTGKLFHSQTQTDPETMLSINNAVLVFLYIFPLLGRLLYQTLHNSFARHLMAISMTWAGFMFFMFFPVLLLDLANALFQFEQNTLFTTTVAMLAILSTLAIYGVVNANLLHVRQVKVSDHRLEEQVHAVQLSDVHIGSRANRFINKIVERVNALQADYVFITGDLVDLSCIGEKELAILGEIQAPVYFVTGNHDRYVRLERLLPRLEAIGFTILRNERLSLPHFDLVGIDDAENPKQVEKIIPGIKLDPSRFTILLYHRPQGFDVAARHGVNLMLSGHTHNGQILPFNLLVKQVFRDIKGTIKRQGAHLHVSSGTSTWGPIMRIGSRNEITSLHLLPGKQ